MERVEFYEHKILTILQYVQNREFLRQQHYRIGPDECGYVVDGKVIPRKEFEKPYPCPISLESNNTINIDGTKNWMAP